MSDSWLDHKKLQIVKGFGKIPSDNSSAEINPTPINLMSGLISLDTNGWSPNIPQVKNGGVWVDSPIQDGRQLLSAPSGNVTEKIVVIITDNSYLGIMKALSDLNQMADDCHSFWESDFQYNPVYLLWWAGCGIGEQYAQIYDIQLSPEYLDSPSPTLRVSITIEREPYWRGIPPGANPKLWTLYLANQTQPNTTNVNLTTQTNDLVYDTNVKNRFEWDTSYANPISRNYLDIPASLIAGDAPALVSLILQATTNSLNVTSSVYVGRTTRPVTALDRFGSTVLQSYCLNAGDAIAPTSWTKTIDANCGCFSNASSVNKYIGRNATLATGSYPLFARWANFNNQRFVDPNLQSGSFAVFWRCKQLNGAAGDVQARFGVTEGNVTITGDYANLPLVSGVVATCDNRFDMLYLGVVTLPLSGSVNSSSDGRGLDVYRKTAGDASYAIQIDVKQNNAATRSVDFLDLVLMPISECLVQLMATLSGPFLFQHYDNTGYISHGQNTQQARTISVLSSDTMELALEARGADLTLIPNVNNRLYFMNQRKDSVAGNNYSAPDSTGNDFTIRLNIVPRWFGIRDS